MKTKFYSPLIALALLAAGSGAHAFDSIHTLECLTARKTTITIEAVEPQGTGKYSRKSLKVSTKIKGLKFLDTRLISFMWDKSNGHVFASGSGFVDNKPVNAFLSVSLLEDKDDKIYYSTGRSELTLEQEDGSKPKVKVECTLTNRAGPEVLF